MRPLLERFTEKTFPVTESGCWIWVGALDAHGYGHISIAGSRSRPMKAHRASWLLHKGEIPYKALICHLCDVKCCVNPAHLYVGNKSTNAVDAYKRGQLQPRRLSACAKGHEYTPENTLLQRRDGHIRRICRTCKRSYEKARGYR